MKANQIVFLLIACLLPAASVAAQRKQITQDEFIKAASDALGKEYEQPRRRRYVIETFSKGKSVKTKTDAAEVLPPDKSHHTITEKNGAARTTMEVIALGADYYTRKNNGAWRKTTEFPSWLDKPRIFRTTEISSEYTLETVKLNAQTVKLFISNVVYKSKTDDSADREIEQYHTAKIWTNKAGSIVKMEDVFGLTKPKNIRTRETTTVDYAANIVIKAPVIKK